MCKREANGLPLWTSTLFHVANEKPLKVMDSLVQKRANYNENVWSSEKTEEGGWKGIQIRGNIPWQEVLGRHFQGIVSSQHRTLWALTAHHDSIKWSFPELRHPTVHMNQRKYDHRNPQIVDNPSYTGEERRTFNSVINKITLFRKFQIAS